MNTSINSAGMILLQFYLRKIPRELSGLVDRILAWSHRPEQFDDDKRKDERVSKKGAPLLHKEGRVLVRPFLDELEACGFGLTSFYRHFHISGSHNYHVIRFFFSANTFEEEGIFTETEYPYGVPSCVFGEDSLQKVLLRELIHDFYWRTWAFSNPMVSTTKPEGAERFWVINADSPSFSTKKLPRLFLDYTEGVLGFKRPEKAKEEMLSR